MRDDRELPCPACGFLTLGGTYGSYVICPVCGWEDDQLQLANPASGGGANSESLVEAQADALDVHRLELASRSGRQGDEVGPVGIAVVSLLRRAGQVGVAAIAA